MSEAIPTRAEAIERTVYWLDVAATSTLNESRCNQALMFAQAYAAMQAGIAVAYVASVVLANVLTEHLGLVSIGFGLVVTAGTFAAGATLLARNIGQDLIGRLAIAALMVIGIALSWWLASPALAVASGVAFALSETTDMGIYSPLRNRGFVVAALVASFCGALVDTIAFLWIAGFPIWHALPGQMIVKFGISALVVALVGVGRALFRKPIHAEGT